jgi:hypothetical protein
MRLTRALYLDAADGHTREGSVQDIISAPSLAHRWLCHGAAIVLRRKVQNHKT